MTVEETHPGLHPVRQRPVQARGLAAVAILLLAALFALSLFCGWVFLQRMARLYQGYIYPNIYALGVDLGGKSPDAAESALRDVARRVESAEAIFIDEGNRWSYSWAEAGIHVDVQKIVQDAVAVGRGGSWKDQLSVWLRYHDIPARYMVNEAEMKALLATLAADISEPAVNPSIELHNGQVVVIPGKAGRVLDVESTYASLHGAQGTLYQVEIPLQFTEISPDEVDTGSVQVQADAWLTRTVSITAYDVLTDQTLQWVLSGEHIAGWLYLAPDRGNGPQVAVDLEKIRDTLRQMAALLGDGRGFRFEQDAGKVLTALENNVTQLSLYLTHPERTYSVVSGDTLTSIAAKFGMPAGLVAERNTGIDVNHLTIGQEIVIPSQDVLTPNMPEATKRVVVSIAEQRVRVYENGVLLWDWPTSTGIETSPTTKGTFQVLGKDPKAYASQWELWMPYFIAVYEAGGGVTNGFHELPILANGSRLWAGSLGRPASFGCIILGIPEAETLYNWADIGVTVVIE